MFWPGLEGPVGQRAPAGLPDLGTRSGHANIRIGTTCYTEPMRNKALRVKAKGAPAIVNGTTPPRRVANAALRPREYLTAEEVERLMQAAAKGKEIGHRDSTMILLAYRHGLRVGELVSLRWDQLDFKRGTFHV